jgi:hypothetical protein
VRSVTSGKAEVAAPLVFFWLYRLSWRELFWQHIGLRCRLRLGKDDF